MDTSKIYTHRGVEFSVPADAITFLQQFNKEIFDQYKERYPINEATKFVIFRNPTIEHKTFTFEVTERPMGSIYSLKPVRFVLKSESRSVPAEWWRFENRGDYRLSFIPELNVVFWT